MKCCVFKTQTNTANQRSTHEYCSGPFIKCQTEMTDNPAVFLFSGDTLLLKCVRGIRDIYIDYNENGPV